MNDINLLGTKAEVDKVIDTFTKEIHFLLDMTIIKEMFEYPIYGKTIGFTFDGTKDLIKSGFDKIYTTQLSLLSFDLLNKGYKIFVHRNSKCLEFRPYMDYSGSKEIRFAHNIEKLVRCGYFDKDFEADK